MKRMFCLLICLALFVPCAIAEDSVDLPRLFNAQFITGGHGVRGKATITVSGVAPWLELLMPFTASEIQIRAIGMPQGELADMVADDDRWQLRLYVEGNEDPNAGDTYLYNGPDGVYIQSKLLPGKVLKAPASGMHLLYDLARQDWDELLFGFDPFNLTGWNENNLPKAYEAMADVIGVDADVWEAEWAPVMQKYELETDLWLTSYGTAATEKADDGSLVMSAVYTIPVEDLKEMAKETIGSMLYDGELQALLAPLVSDEVRAVYLNPGLIYFYNACIDALPLSGDVVLSRETTAMGETLSTTISLPVPQLPAELADAAGKLLAEVFALPYENALSGMNRLILRSNGSESSLELSGDQRVITLTAKNAETENARDITGALRITPGVAVDETPLFAAYTLHLEDKTYEDDDYVTHQERHVALTLKNDDTLDNAANQAAFAPVSLAFSAHYRNDSHTENKPVQINLALKLQLADADVSADVVLRTRAKWDMVQLPTEGAIDLTAASDEQLELLRNEFISNAVSTMVYLNVPEAPDVPEEEPSAVPPLGNE